MSAFYENSLQCYTDKFWCEFIELYESLPVLWDTTCGYFRNKSLTDSACTILTNKLKEVEPNASTYLVRCKITALRNKYRNEWKIIQEHQKRGQNHDISWWFHTLDFLRPHITLSETRDFIEVCTTVIVIGSFRPETSFRNSRGSLDAFQYAIQLFHFFT